MLVFLQIEHILLSPYCQTFPTQSKFLATSMRCDISFVIFMRMIISRVRLLQALPYFVKMQPRNKQLKVGENFGSEKFFNYKYPLSNFFTLFNSNLQSTLIYLLKITVIAVWHHCRPFLLLSIR